MICYAHSRKGAPEAHWQPLRGHLENVGRLAAEFAGTFGAERLGRFCGIRHDLGKFSEVFQQYLRVGTENRKPEDRDHSTAGAQAAAELSPSLGVLCAYAIAGHHAGLPNWMDGSRGSLKSRLAKPVPPWRDPDAEALIAGFGFSAADFPSALLKFMSDKTNSAKFGFELALFVRMLFSALVDADWLDTEAFCAPELAAARPAWPPDMLERMATAAERYLATLRSDSEIGQIRSRILAECRAAADREPGIFTLTVPTGGGKTLSSLVFALRHARKYGKARVIYVVPYLSIIEQNAAVFRRALAGIAPDPVLEVHSNVGEGGEAASDGDGSENVRRLAAENFDSPLVVTTAVQFYETLFADRPSRCRKLHNFANSVIIFDEVQKVPVQYLDPVIAAWRSLSEIYGSTLVMCTATQPALWENPYLLAALPSPRREIVSDPAGLYAQMRRTEAVNLGPQSDAELIARFAGEERMLCVVNTIFHAKKLFDGLEKRAGDSYLTTRIYPFRRAALIRLIRRRLRAGKPCRVIATNLVEAGVDLDFPTVYRAMAGVDSITQAAGRCNREGKSPTPGRVYVFAGEHVEREKFLNSERNAGAEVLATQPDVFAPAAVEQYFRIYFAMQRGRMDEKDILGLFSVSGGTFAFSFAECAEKFRMIDSDTVGVVIPVGRARGWCQTLRASPVPDFRLIRKLQRYAVPLPRKTAERHIGREIETAANGSVLILISPELHYDARTGLNFENEPAGLVL